LRYTLIHFQHFEPFGLEPDLADLASGKDPEARRGRNIIGKMNSTQHDLACYNGIHLRFF
jgi:hypothetical protein